MIYFGALNALFLMRLLQKPAVQKGRFLYYCVLTCLFLFSAFRYEVGCDWSGYWNQYVIAFDLDIGEMVEMRESLWWAILQYFNQNSIIYPWANVFSSAVFFIGIHAMARRQPDPLGFLVLLFPILIVNMPMSGIRQGAAIGLMCFAFLAFIDRRRLSFVFWVIVASGFHSSALMFLLLTPIIARKYTRGRLLLAGLLALPGIFFVLDASGSDELLDRYVDTGIDAFGAVYRVSLLAMTGAAFLFMFGRSWARSSRGDYGLVELGSILMLGLFFLLPLSTVIADRVGYYLIPIQTMIFARLPMLSLGSYRKVYAFAPYGILLAVFTVWIIFSSLFQKCYLPYQTWLFGVPDPYSPWLLPSTF